MIDPADKARIGALTVRIVAGMIEKGEVDPDDDAALKKASQEAAQMAKEVYFAALEYISG